VSRTSKTLALLLLLCLAISVLGCARASDVADHFAALPLPDFGGVAPFWERANASGKLNGAWEKVRQGESVPAAIKDAQLSRNAGEAARTLNEAANVQRAFDQIGLDVAKSPRIQTPVSSEVQAVTCFVVGSVVAHNRLPTGEEYERFGVTAKVKQVTGLGREVERAQSFLDLVAKIQNNTPDRIAFKLGMKLVCGVLLGQ